MQNHIVYWLWLVQAIAPASRTLWKLLDRFDGNPTLLYEIFQEKGASALEGLNLHAAEINRLEKTTLSQGAALLEVCQQHNWNVVTYDDPFYPEALRNIYNPPVVLFCIGNPDICNHAPAITIVGTRRPSSYSVRVSEHICRNLAATGACIVSGFALGIDAVAHDAALKTHGGKTAAVLACGLDVPYPKENAPFKDIIAARGGVVLTELLPGTKTSRGYFSQRNRILSGLSLATLVMEADARSGSLITANLALEQGRDVFTLPPHDLFDARYAGQNRLLREGASPLISHMDVVNAYPDQFAQRLTSAVFPGDLNQTTSRTVSAPPKERSEKAPADNSKDRQKETGSAEMIKLVPVEPTNPVAESIPQPHINLPPEQTALLDFLERHQKDGPVLADELATAMQWELQDLLVHLTELELLGMVNALAGKRYALRK